ncbi:MAG TPA: hypothetical protein VHK91_16200 [Flavisolibacter sp.]|jgi:hypothetical protein|nr:hypothetical protein [Flavisolibacter sp.]
MKLSDFILLNEEEKKSTVLHEGILIGKRSSPSYMIFLFQLESYYVETFCSAQSRSIEEFRVFDTLKPLDPYLDMISLDGLLN